MPRILAGLFAVLVCALLSPPGEPSGRVVDLNEPGVLETLQGSNPVHYGKIRRILEDVLKYPDAGVPRWMQTTFNAQNVKYIPIVLTSHPPKRQLSFSLDSARYEVVIVLTNVRGDIVPAREVVPEGAARSLEDEKVDLICAVATSSQASGNRAGGSRDLRPDQDLTAKRLGSSRAPTRRGGRSSPRHGRDDD